MLCIPPFLRSFRPMTRIETLSSYRKATLRWRFVPHSKEEAGHPRRSWIPFVRTQHILGCIPNIGYAALISVLGHWVKAVSYGVGAALAARMRKSSRRVFVLISDGECNEGTIWVAIMFPPHHQLANLITLVDLNGQRALGYKQDVLNLSPLADRWRAFGWDVHDVHGHDAAELAMAIADLDTTSGPPHVLIVHTTFGKGVSFMENQLEWHYWPLSAAEYQQALLEIDAAL